MGWGDPEDKKTPIWWKPNRGLNSIGEYCQLFLFDARFEALSGLMRTLATLISGFWWVAKLQIPNLHLASGLT